LILAYVLPSVWNGAIAISTGLFFGLCAAAFLPLYVGALYFKKMTKAAALSGMAAGAGASLIWMLFFHTKEASVFGIVSALTGGASQTLTANPVIQTLDPLFIGLPVSIIVTIVVQVLSKKKLSQELIDQSFDGVGKSA